jgi:hypothetical protein
LIDAFETNVTVQVSTMNSEGGVIFYLWVDPRSIGGKQLIRDIGISATTGVYVAIFKAGLYGK